MLISSDSIMNSKTVVHNPCDHLYRVTGLENVENIAGKELPPKETDVEKSEKDEPADFETAISATGYGRFHIFLLLASMPAYWTCVSVSTTISYTLAGAECDLGIGMMDKGLLNSMTYTGMMTSGIVWGYLSDILGRKKIIAYGIITVAFIELLGSFSQQFWMLLVSKFFVGMVFNGPFAVLLTYIAELHPTTIRAKVVVMSGLFYSMALVGIPLIALAVIPNNWDLYFFGGALEIHSWNIFLAIFSLPPLISGLAMLTVPESPKFLMTKGRNEEALKIFRQIYSQNTGLPPETYPIKKLILERGAVDKNNNEQEPRGLQAVMKGFKQMTPFLSRPFLPWLLLLCAISFFSMYGENSLRLWFPQIAAILEDYTHKHTEPAGLCEMLTTPSVNNITLDSEVTVVDKCVKLEIGPATYVNSIIVGASSMVSYTIGGLLINRVGKKRLVIACYGLAALCPIALPWTTSVSDVVIVCSIFLSITGTCSGAISSILVDLFPTSLRAMSVAAFMLFGRLGTITGNILFPALLGTGCMPPFFTIAAVVVATSIGCTLLPKTTLKRME